MSFRIPTLNDFCPVVSYDTSRPTIPAGRLYDLVVTYQRMCMIEYELLHKDLTEMTSRCARAEVKAEQFNELTESLGEAKAKVDELSALNMKLDAELDATKITVTNLNSSLQDAKEQRDKAQQLTEKLNIRISSQK
ncbi:hypothetical protein ACED51_10700 [Photobacterium swingsii]|uniref:hypothetical protein n=1 Tax=Photobacterium swingsii TaxID=680026 RepID=UPI00352F9D75